MPNQTELPVLSRLVESVAPTPLQPVQLQADLPTIWCKLEYLTRQDPPRIALLHTSFPKLGAKAPSARARWYAKPRAVQRALPWRWFVPRWA